MGYRRYIFMLEKHLEVLRAVRANKLDIKTFAYEEALDEEGYSYDKNETKRFQLITAMQYDRNEQDEPLLQELIKQEILMHEEAPLQGHYPSLSLCAHLLARFRNPANVWLFVDAKLANFDTFYGLDYQHLVSAGIEETYRYVEDSTHELKPSFYEIVGEEPDKCYISRSELEEWRQSQARRYPSQLKVDSVEDLISLAIDLDEQEILKEKIGEWKARQTEWTESNLRQLAYYERQIDHLHGVIFAEEEAFKFKKTDWDRTGQLQKLAELYLKLGQPEVAWEKIRALRTYLKNISDWKQVGLGRFIIENTFEIVISLSDPDNEISQESYTWALGEVSDMENLYLNLLQKIVDAARIMGDKKTEEAFLAAYLQEKKLIDEISEGKR